MVVWWLTRTECLSAFARRLREGVMSARDERRARQFLKTLSQAWSEVQPSESVRTVAERLLAVHDLRSADALQLAAALEWCDARPSGVAFVCLDARLRQAAQREGFEPFPAED